MRNRSTLVMIEHIVMLLVFVLAATVCVRMFVLSEKLSRKYEATDLAVLAAQNTAELLKKGGIAAFAEEEGVLQTEENTWMVYYDENGNRETEDTGVLSVEVVYSEEESGCLFRAEIRVLSEEGEGLFRLPVAGQIETEVTADETI